MSEPPTKDQLTILIVVVWMWLTILIPGWLMWILIVLSQIRGDLRATCEKLDGEKGGQS